MASIYLPHEAEVVERVEETPSIFTLRLRFTDHHFHERFRFQPGQFNMVYLYGVGEVPVSIVSDPETDDLLEHTIRSVGRVTRGLARLQAGDRVGIRGPYGRGWPLLDAEGKDVVLVTGGLGCAPLVSVIRYLVNRRDLFQRLVIMQGVKHSDDLIWAEQYKHWAALPDTQVMLAASEEPAAAWPWYSGHITNLMGKAVFNPANTTAMMCGPEPMMRAAIEPLIREGVPEEHIWISMERSMHCAVGSCGHCQYGDKFVCRDGPVFSYGEIKKLFGTKGF